MPDFEYLAERARDLRGIVLTHGHEDHIGALAFALQAAPAPVYGSRLTLGFARERLRSGQSPPTCASWRRGSRWRSGPSGFIRSASRTACIDSLALAIETPAGVVLTSGDFKIDRQADPASHRPDALAWGDRGVLVLLSDSTDVEERGPTPARTTWCPRSARCWRRTRGRVLVSCFATSIPRIAARGDLAKAGRSIGFLGRRMADNSEVALDLGLLRLPGVRGWRPARWASLAARALLFVSGSQGEPMSALSLISVGEHRELAVGPGDMVVLSARAIPGNERVVSRLIGNLIRHGCDVVHPGTARVHVSGHGSRDDLLELLRACGRATWCPSTASTACWRSTGAWRRRRASPPTACWWRRTARCCVFASRRPHGRPRRGRARAARPLRRLRGRGRRAARPPPPRRRKASWCR